MKEFFWLGDKDRNGFKSKQQLQTAISDIRSIGWEIASYVLWDFSYRKMPNWYHGKPGAVTYVDEKGTVQEYMLMVDNVHFLKISDVSENLGCGIFLYEVRPTPEANETIPKHTTVSYANKYKYGSILEINKREYFISPQSDVESPQTDQPNQEVFWIGHKSGSGFKTAEDLRTAVYNIKSIGWDVADFTTADPNFKLPSWNAYGLAKKYDKGDLIMSKIKVNKGIEFLDRGMWLNPTPDCGIYIYNVKPNANKPETIPEGTKVYNDPGSSFPTYIDINGTSYFISFSKTDMGIDADDGGPDLKTESETLILKKETPTADPKTKELNERVDKLKETMQSRFEIQRWFYIALMVLIVIIVYIAYTNRMTIKALSDKLDILKSDFSHCISE